MVSPKEQVDAARASALVIARPDLAVIVVSGKDRISWLNGLVTCDLGKWEGGAGGEASYGLIVLRSGRVLADPVLFADGERAWALVAVDLVPRVREHLDHYLVMEDAEMGPADEAFSVWQIHGSRAAEVLAAAREAGATGAAFDPTGLGGAVVVAPPEAVGPVRAALEGAVAAVGGVFGDVAGWEALRLERGVPRLGVDFDDKTYPQEASLEKNAVSFQKGCYLGQEVVCMLEMRGHVKRKLVSLVFVDGAPPAAGAEVIDAAGEPVGEVTSAAMSPTLGVPVGLAMVKRAQAVSGADLVVGGAHAKVVERPA